MSTNNKVIKSIKLFRTPTDDDWDCEEETPQTNSYEMTHKGILPHTCGVCITDGDGNNYIIGMDETESSLLNVFIFCEDRYYYFEYKYELYGWCKSFEGETIRTMNITDKPKYDIDYNCDHYRSRRFGSVMCASDFMEYRACHNEKYKSFKTYKYFEVTMSDDTCEWRDKALLIQMCVKDGSKYYHNIDSYPEVKSYSF